MRERLAENARAIAELERLASPAAATYPTNWPMCPGCGKPAMDGHITCGEAKCAEGAQRDKRMAIAR